MPGWIPLRLRPLLGADLDEVTVESLQRLIGMREDRDLEFKRERYGTSDGQKKEAAYDVAALANASGGVIIIGMQEDGSDVAAGLSPQGDAGDFGAWLHQVVAARVSPAVQINSRSLSNPEGFVHVVCVEPSTRKPHGVHVGDEALRYPIRSGTTKRYLVESEVADMYSRRFFTQASVDDMVAGLHSTARSLTTAAGKRGSVAFLTLSCVPSSPGSLDLEDGVQDRWLEWANVSIRHFPMSLRLLRLDMERMFRPASVGFRSIELADWLDEQRNFYSLFARLSLDGSGTVIFGYPESTEVDDVDTTWSVLFDEQVFGDVVNGLEVLSQHASATGAVGDLTIGAQVFSECPIVLSQDRHLHIGPSRIGGRIVSDATPIAMRSTTIAGAAALSPSLLGTARMLATDLFSAFGLAQPKQVTVQNQLALEGFREKQHQALKAWATNAGVEVV